MRKIVKVTRKNIKIVIGIMIGLSLGCIGIIAKTITSKEVSYTNTKSNVTNVQEAIEELYGKLQSKFHVLNLTENGARYTGKNPNNYVSFNGELWRIIGIFDGKIKIIKNKSIGAMQWNNTASNDWASSSLYQYLNTTYYNGINATYKNMIENATWKIGSGNTSDVTTSQMYGYEETQTTTGYIGLMNASDYGYASSGCYGGFKTLKNYNNSVCTSKNWLYSGIYEWTIMPYSSDTKVGFIVHNNGYIDLCSSVTNVFETRPSLYLKSSVIITGGIGTSNDPYTLEI